MPSSLSERFSPSPPHAEKVSTISRRHAVGATIGRPHAEKSIYMITTSNGRGDHRSLGTKARIRRADKTRKFAIILEHPLDKRRDGCYNTIVILRQQVHGKSFAFLPR